jgi:hypothetical protein
MLTKSKLTLFAALAAASIASPAFAQSIDRTGSMLPYHYDASGAQIRGTWAPEATIAKPRLVPVEHKLYMHAQDPAFTANRK